MPDDDAFSNNEQWESRDEAEYWFRDAADLARFRICRPEWYTAHATNYVDVLCWIFKRRMNAEWTGPTPEPAEEDDSTDDTQQQTLMTDGGQCTDTDAPDWWQERQEYIREAVDKGWPYWRVVVRLDCHDGKQIFGAHAPHRSGAKTRVQYLLDDSCDVVEWVRTYIPRPSWDCSKCHTHEAMITVPNLRGPWDWECTVCDYRTVGHPQNPEKESQ